MSEQRSPTPLAGHALSARDRRAAARHECSEGVCWLCSSAGEMFWADLKDVSRTGIGIVIDRDLNPGRTLTFFIPIGGRPACKVSAAAVHSARYSSDTWLVGARFNGPLSLTELRWVLYNMAAADAVPDTRPVDAPAHRPTEELAS